MKKIFFTLISILILSHVSYAQWTTSGANIYNSNTGSVGIGTLLPGTKLHVLSGSAGGMGFPYENAVFENVGDQKVGIYTTATTLGATGTSLAFGNTLATNTAGRFPGFEIQNINASTPDASYLRFNYLERNTNGTVNFTGTRQSVLSITGLGKVGIGTLSPNMSLDVKGAITVGNGNLDPAVTNLNFLAGSGQVLIGQNRTASANEADFISNQAGGSTGGFAFYNHNNSNVETQLMWILGNGNVLIGKTTQANATYKLDVNGNVRANQVVINTTGADFVFAPTYHLNSLAYVQKYIEQNHHLPGIEPAKQMQANGLNVGENQTKLLQKVEELTLYLIESDKTNKAQQAEIDKGKQKLLDQENRIKLLEAKLEQLLKTKN